MSSITLTFVGRDSWDRPVYTSGDKLYVDINPVSYSEPSMHTKLGNSFDGEPDCPLHADALEFIPSRDVWR